MEQHPNVPQAHPLKWKTVVRGAGGPTVAGNEVIDDADELAEYAESCSSADEGAQVANAKPKFEREKVIAIAVGVSPEIIRGSQ